MSKKTYRVLAEVTTMCYLDIEAKDKDDALDYARYAADGGDFVSKSSGGGFEVLGEQYITEVETEPHVRLDDNGEEIE